jgi:hypothetical protein
MRKKNNSPIEWSGVLSKAKLIICLSVSCFSRIWHQIDVYFGIFLFPSPTSSCSLALMAPPLLRLARNEAPAVLRNLPNPSTRAPSRHLTLEPPPAAGRSSRPAEPRMKTEVTYPVAASVRPRSSEAARMERTVLPAAGTVVLKRSPAGRAQMWGIGLRRNETRPLSFFFLLQSKDD